MAAAQASTSLHEGSGPVRTPPVAEVLDDPASLDLTVVTLEDMEDPRKWNQLHKWSIVVLISLMGFISPLGSSIVIPGANAVDHEFRLFSRPLSLFPVSFFVLGLGAGPFCLAPASEMVGRRPIYLATSIVFVLFNVGTATVRSFPGLCILRFIAGVFGSTGPSLGAGSIGDLFAPAERGRAQSLYGLGPLLGPVIGNIIGGWIIQNKPRSWRWLLWTLTIMSGAIAVIICICLHETYGPVLLQKKRAALATARIKHLKALEKAQMASADDLERVSSRLDGHRPTIASRLSGMLHPSPEAKAKWKHAFSRPFRLLFTNPICAIFSLYLGFCYGIVFLFLVEHPLLYQRRESHDDPPPDKLPTYGWRAGPASLSYTGLGIGFLAAAFINAFFQDPIYQRLTSSGGRIGLFLFKSPAEITALLSAGDSEKQTRAATSEGTRPPAALSGQLPLTSPPVKKGRPEYRLPLCLLGMFVLPVGLFVFGWTAQGRCHWAVPLIGSLLVGAGTILCFQSILVYLVDAFIPYSASATACAVLVRSILAAVFPLFAQRLYRDLGFGWGSSLLAFIALAGVPVPIVLFKYGPRLRAAYKFDG